MVTNEPTSTRADYSVPRCYAISALGDSLKRYRVSSLLARLSPSHPAISALCPFALSLSVSQLNNANNSLLLLEYLASYHVAVSSLMPEATQDS